MEENKINSFLNYKQTVLTLTSDLKQLSDYSQKFQLSGNQSSIQDVLKRLAEDSFNVAVVGEFKRGKSTMINALLGKVVLPADVLPATATVNRVTYGVTPFARIEYLDGRVEDIEVDRLEEYVTKLTPESESVAKTVKVATVFYPIHFCKNGVTIIDTPGLCDDDTMTNVTLSILPQVDAAIMVILAGSPFSQSEREFLENKIITSDLGRVLFVVTGIDLVSEDDAKKILANIRKRIEDSVLLKTKNTFGEDSEEFALYKSKLGSLRIYGVSSKNALKGKQKCDNAMLEESKFPVFETALERFLTEERGAISLTVPVNRIKTAAMEIVKTANLRESALSMEREEFTANYNKAMVEIEKIRKERQMEFSRINEAMQSVYLNLTPAIQDYWPKLEQAAERAIDEYVIKSADELKDPAEKTTRENLISAVRSAMTDESQIQTEKIQSVIGAALEKEAVRLSGFEEKFFNATEAVQNLFVPESQKKLSNLDTAIGVAGNAFLLMGIGGVYTGFKEAGWKGALLGGATGAAGTFAASAGAGILLGLLAIPITWPVAIVAAVGAALVGTFTSKWAIGKFLFKDTAQKYKDSFKEATIKQLKTMKAESDFGMKVREQVTTAFDALKERIRTETEKILTDVQSQLDQLNADIAKNQGMSEREKQEIDEILKQVDVICDRANELGKQLSAVAQ